MDGIPQRAGCYALAAACVLGGALSAPAQAADPSIALILGVKGSRSMTRSPAARSMRRRSLDYTSTFLHRTISPENLRPRSWTR
jgi:hypothetical protein